MELVLSKKPKNPIIIQGFPGFGLVGNIATEFLIEHLKAEQIGSIKIKEIMPVIALHEGKVVHPVGIFYDKNTNIVLVHVIANAQGVEWILAEQIANLAKQLNASEIISIEGVSAPYANETNFQAFYYTNDEKCKKKLEAVLKPLKEGIVVGVTGALLLDVGITHTSIFVESHSGMPDSKAAAKAIEVLDKYLGLSIDYQPLLKQAEKFEEKLKKIMEQSQSAVAEQDKKKLDYIS